MWIFKKKREALPAAEVCVRLHSNPPLTPEERRKKLICDIKCDVSYAINELEMEFTRDSSYIIYQITCDLQKTLKKCDRLLCEEE